MNATAQDHILCHHDMVSVTTVKHGFCLQSIARARITVASGRPVVARAVARFALFFASEVATT